MAAIPIDNIFKIFSIEKYNTESKMEEEKPLEKVKSS